MVGKNAVWINKLASQIHHSSHITVNACAIQTYKNHSRSLLFKIPRSPECLYECRKSLCREGLQETSSGFVYTYIYKHILVFPLKIWGCFVKILGALRGFTKPPYKECFMKLQDGGGCVNPLGTSQSHIESVLCYVPLFCKATRGIIYMYTF